MRIIVFTTCMLVTWWVLADIEIVPSLYLPHPYEVAVSMKAKLIGDTLASLGRALFGLSVGVIAAYAVHFFTVITGTVKALDPQFAASRAVPVIALMPLFLLWFGFGETGRLLLVTLTGMLFFLAPLQAAFKSIPREWTILREQLELGSSAYYRKIVMPATLAQLRGSFRLVAAICFTIAIGTDYMGAQVGIGKFIDSARVTFNVPGVFLALIVSAIVGLSIDRAVVYLYDSFVHWEGKTSKA